jgi:hypothetical protein
MRVVARQPWNPTRAQERAALHLSDDYVGGSVRSLPDGSAELLTMHEGEFRHYVIFRDGSPMLVDSRPATWRYPWGKSLLLVGGLLMTGGAASLALIKFVAHAPVPGWALALTLLGMGLVFVGEWFVIPRAREPRGERWTAIGGADF